MKALDAAGVGAALMFWAFNFVAGKWGLSQVPPLLLMSLRFALVAALLVPFVTMPRGHLRAIALLSVTLGLLHFSLMFSGLAGLDAGTAAIAVQTQVVFAAIIAAAFYGDRLGWRRTLGMACAFAGVAVLSGEPRIGPDPTPLLLVIASALMWAVSNVQVKEMGPVDGFALNAYLALFAAPQLLAASLVLESGQAEALAAADWRLPAAVVFMAVCAQIAAYVIWYRMVRLYPVNLIAPLTLLVPVLAVGFGAVFFAEPLTWRVLVGGLAIIAGVGVIVVRRPRLAEPEATGKSS